MHHSFRIFYAWIAYWKAISWIAFKSCIDTTFKSSFVQFRSLLAYSVHEKAKNPWFVFWPQDSNFFFAMLFQSRNTTKIIEIFNRLMLLILHEKTFWPLSLLTALVLPNLKKNFSYTCGSSSLARFRCAYAHFNGYSLPTTIRVKIDETVGNFWFVTSWKS